MYALPNAQSGLSIRQLCRNDSKFARKKLNLIFENGESTSGFIAEKESDNSEAEEKSREVSVNAIHGMELHLLVDTGATLNIFTRL